jgi:hypothetical protein
MARAHCRSGADRRRTRSSTDPSDRAGYANAFEVVRLDRLDDKPQQQRVELGVLCRRPGLECQRSVLHQLDELFTRGPSVRIRRHDLVHLHSQIALTEPVVEPTRVLQRAGAYSRPSANNRSAV